MQPMASDVTSHHPQLTRWNGKDVVPVTTHELLRGQVARGELKPRTLRQATGKQAALKVSGRHSLDRQLPSLHGPGHPFGDHLQKFDIGFIEWVGMKPAYVEY